MKQIILSFLILGFAVTAVKAQCGKRNVITSSQWELLDSAGATIRTLDRNFFMEFDDKEITVIPGESGAGTGKVEIISCEWKTPFKEGKTVFKSTITDPEGKLFPIKVVIEGKDGKVTARIDIDDPEQRPIKLIVDKFEEKK